MSRVSLLAHRLEINDRHDVLHTAAGVSHTLRPLVTLESGYTDRKGRGAMPEWCMREPSANGIAECALGALVAAPQVGLVDTAFTLDYPWSEPLADHRKSEFIATAERREIDGLKGALAPVEVFCWAVLKLPSSRGVDLSASIYAGQPLCTLNSESR